MTFSATDPITRAIERAKLITFQPFDFGKWLVLGFSAFLASLDEGGSFNFNGISNPFGGGRTGGGPMTATTQPAALWDDFTSWISTHRFETALIAIAFVLTIVVISLVVLWLNSRGKFMFIDCIAKNTAEVIAPWKRYRQLGNSLFAFRVCLSAISFLAMLVIAGIALLLAWNDIQAKTFGSGAISAIIAGVVLMVPTFLVLGLIQWCTVTFVTPIMYVRDATVLPAWREFRQVIVPGNVGSLILFLLMSIVLGIAVGIGRGLLGCLTLCIGFLPYLSSVVTLPLAIFMRSYSIYFLQQFGPQYVIMNDPPAGFGFPVIMPPMPPVVG